MFNHAPPDYDCPLCAIIAGDENDPPWTQQADVVLRTDEVIAWVNPKWWGDIKGNVVVVPVRHVENLYDLDDELAVSIHRVARRIAIAMKTAYGCAGVSTRQHNEPAGNQDAFHYHLHVFPRYARDDLYGQPARLVDPAERAPYVAKLKAAL